MIPANPSQAAIGGRLFPEAVGLSGNCAHVHGSARGSRTTRVSARQGGRRAKPLEYREIAGDGGAS